MCYGIIYVGPIEVPGTWSIHVSTVIWCCLMYVVIPGIHLFVSVNVCVHVVEGLRRSFARPNPFVLTSQICLKQRD